MQDIIRMLTRSGLPAGNLQRWQARGGNLTRQAAAREGEIAILGPILAAEDKEFWDSFLEGDSVTVSDASFRAALDEVSGDVMVRINSPGGDVFAASGIHTAMLERRKAGDRVDVQVDGIAASAASLVMTAGDKVTISPLGSVMLHEVWACMCGNAADFETAAVHMNRENDQIAGVYAARMNASVDDVRAMLAEETWLTSIEALEKGLVDEVLAVDPAAGEDGKRKMQSRADWMARRAQNMARLSA